MTAAARGASRSAIGRGTVYNALARVAFLLSGYVIHFSTAYLLASPQEYGTLGVVVSLVTLARVFFSLGLPQSVAHHMAADEQRAYVIWRVASKVQVLGSLAVMLLYLGVAWLWSGAVGDRSLVKYIAVSAPIIPLMAWYQINLAYFNGRLWFRSQAKFVFIYSVARATLVVALVAVGFAVYGALAGLVLAIAIVAVGSYSAVPRGDTSLHQEWRPLVSFSAPLVLVAIGTSVLLNFDILVLKSFFPMSPSVGYYNAAMNLGKTPYFVFAAVSTTLLPAVSNVLKHEGKEAARRLVRTSVSYLWMVSVPVAVIVALTADRLMDFVYPADFVVGAPTLAVLIVSMCGLALLGLLNAAMTSAARPRLAMAVVVMCLPVQACLAVYLVPRFGMVGAALANLATVLFGTLVASVASTRLFGSVYDFRRLAKSGFAIAPVAAALICLDQFPLLLLPLVYAGGCAVYLGLLLAFRAVTLSQLRKLLSKSKRPRQDER